MRIVCISDIHGETTYIARLGKVLEQADLVLVAGDITNFGNAKDAEKVLGEISAFNRNILAVTGNCDNPDVEEYIDGLGISVHRKVEKFSGISVAGLSGSLPTPVKTPNTAPESVFSSYLETLEKSPDILLVHQPPFDTIADRVMGIRHVGCKAIRAAIDRLQPKLCLCGHIHESGGIEKCGNTMVINPGPFKTGSYASVEIDSREVINARIFRI